MKLKSLILSLLIIAGVGGAKAVAAQSFLLQGIPCAASGNCTPCDFVQLFVNAANILVGLSGTFAIIMFVYGGLVMITAYGNESRVKWGKEILIATVVGILIVFLAWTFINLIIEAFFGSSGLPGGGPWQNVGGQCS